MLYAGGEFTTAGGAAANYAASWNGSAWQALGSGMNGGVRAWTVGSDGTLYAGGYFSTAGGVTANYIAKWTNPDIAVTQGTTSVPDTGSYNFGSVMIGSTKSVTFTIANTGPGPLSLTGSPYVALSGNAAFTVTSQPSTPIISGATQTFVVKFAPTSTGPMATAVTIESNDSDAENPYTFTLNGSSVANYLLWTK